MEEEAVRQMENACRIPAAARGALMPDAHTGYGLPIGGVLAVRNAVIPYAVGVDIACRMRLTVLDMPLSRLFEHRDAFIMAIERKHVSAWERVLKKMPGGSIMSWMKTGTSVRSPASTGTRHGNSSAAAAAETTLWSSGN